MYSNVAPKSPLKAYYAPPRQNNSLKVDDIPGAQPNTLIAVSKNILHYQTKLSNDYSKYSENLTRQASFNKHELMYGGELAHGSPVNTKKGKKHFGEHYDSEITKTNALRREDGRGENKILAVLRNSLNFDFPRNLSIDDIPGATSGSKKPKSVVNYELAQRMRRGLSVQKERPEQSDLQYRHGGDSLDRFQNDQRENNLKPKNVLHLEKIESNYSQQGGYGAGGNTAPARDQSPEYQMRENVDAPFSLQAVGLYEPPKVEKQPMDNYNLRPQQNHIAQQDYQRDSMELNRVASMPKFSKPEIEVSSGNGYRDSRIVSRMGDGSSNLLRSSIGTLPRIAPQDPMPWKDSAQDLIYQNQGMNRKVSGATIDPSIEMKKVYTFNIISNKPTPKMLPSNSKIPYKYAIPFDVERLSMSNSSKTPSYVKDTPPHLTHTTNIHNLVLKSDNIGRGYNNNQSVPVGRDYSAMNKDNQFEMNYNNFFDGAN